MDLCSGRNRYKYLLAPGKTVSARFHGVLFGHFEAGEGELQQRLTVYALTEEGIREAEKISRLTTAAPTIAGLQMKRME